MMIDNTAKEPKMIKANLYYGNGHGQYWDYGRYFTDKAELVSYMSELTKEYMAQSSVLEIFEDTGRVMGQEYDMIRTESDSDYGLMIAIIKRSQK